MQGYLAPREIAAQVADNCEAKCSMSGVQLAVLGIMAGAYIAFGAELSTMVTHDLAKHIGLGLTKLVGGAVFSVGLMLVVLGGAELWTGNCLMVTGVLSRRSCTGSLLRNWAIVYLANFVGSLLLVGVMYASGLWKLGGSGVGAAALTTASQKVGLTFSEALARGIGCNWLVCLAVWLAVAGKDIASKIMGIFFPVMAFVASGFEHSIANMYFIPIGLALKGRPDVVAASGLGDKVAALTWSHFLTGNLIPVTLGNLIGGALFVGTAYYLVYLRRQPGRSLLDAEQPVPDHLSGDSLAGR